MNIVDIILIFIFISSIFIGYRRGLLIEIYDLGAIIAASILAYLLKIPATNYFNTYFDFKEITHLKINDSMYQMMINSVGNILGFIYSFIIILLFFKIVLFILKKKHIIPIKIENYSWVGSIILFLKAVFLTTVIGFLLSFAFVTKYGNLYENSVMAKPLLKLNGPLYDTSNNIINIYKNFRKSEKQVE